MRYIVPLHLSAAACDRWVRKSGKTLFQPAPAADALFWTLLWTQLIYCRGKIHKEKTTVNSVWPPVSLHKCLLLSVCFYPQELVTLFSKIAHRIEHVALFCSHTGWASRVWPLHRLLGYGRRLSTGRPPICTYVCRGIKLLAVNIKIHTVKRPARR